jgi:hypothetical protein
MKYVDVDASADVISENKNRQLTCNLMKPALVILSVVLLCLLYAAVPSGVRNGVSRFQPHWWPAA